MTSAAIIYLCVTTVCCGLFLTLRDLPVISGSILASGAGERIYMRILLPVILLASIAFSALRPIGMAPGFSVPVYDAALLLPAGIATLITCAIISGFSRFIAAPLAFMGSLAGISGFIGTAQTWEANASYIISWIVAPLLCGVLAAVAYRSLASLGNRRHIHMAVIEGRLAFASGIAAVLLAIAFGINNSAVFSLIPLSVAGFGPIAAGIAVICALLCYLTLRKRIENNEWTVADTDLDVNSESTLSVLLSMAIVLGLFSTSIPSVIHLSATPLPAGTLFVAALTGISLTRGRALIEAKDISRCAIASVLSPALAAMISYSLSLLINGNLTRTLVIVGMMLLIGGIILVLRKKDDQELQSQIVRAREQQIYSTQRSLSALEVKAEMTEQDLMGKLEIKRKELVDFAVGVSDQKKFMEDIYDELKSVRAMEDGADKDAATGRLLATLRQRMYFTREMNDFYARSEVLHKDFNMRLQERYPGLTEGERKLANLLRQGFSSKYIASLMNITPKSVEINRYRLRSKLGLNREDNLTQFIKTI